MKNSKPDEKTNLQKLLEKQAKLKEQIKLEQKREVEKTKQIYTQKCILVGALILEHINKNGEFSEKILNILNSSIKSESEKTLLGLKSSPDKNNNDTMKSVHTKGVA